MSFIELWKNFLGRRPSSRNAPTGEVAWDEATYIPNAFWVGITEIRSGRFIKAESGFTELLVVYAEECEIEETRSKEKHTMKKGDLIVIKKGAKLKLESSFEDVAQRARLCHCPSLSRDWGRRDLEQRRLSDLGQRENVCEPILRRE